MASALLRGNGKRTKRKVKKGKKGMENRVE